MKWSNVGEVTQSSSGDEAHAFMSSYGETAEAEHMLQYV